jgi:hypothetical protein
VRAEDKVEDVCVSVEHAMLFGWESYSTFQRRVEAEEVAEPVTELDAHSHADALQWERAKAFAASMRSREGAEEDIEAKSQAQAEGDAWAEGLAEAESHAEAWVEAQALAWSDAQEAQVQAEEDARALARTQAREASARTQAREASARARTHAEAQAKTFFNRVIGETRQVKVEEEEEGDGTYIRGLRGQMWPVPVPKFFTGGTVQMRKWRFFGTKYMQNISDFQVGLMQEVMSISHADAMNFTRGDLKLLAYKLYMHVGPIYETMHDLWERMKKYAEKNLVRHNYRERRADELYTSPWGRGPFKGPVVRKSKGLGIRNNFSDEETMAIREGYAKHGNDFAGIKADPAYSEILAKRSNVDIKDKVRNFLKAQARTSGNAEHAFSSPSRRDIQENN